jgi:8-oxo-dGTP diphosphatase
LSISKAQSAPKNSGVAIKQPIISVGAVIFRNTEVLLIKRAKPPFKGHWSIPGGKVDYGESLEAALAREVGEETGIEIRILGLINAFESLPDGPDAPDANDPHFVMLDYVADWVRGEPQASDDAEEAEFMPFDEALSRLAWDQTRLALQQAKAARNRIQK